MKFLKVCGKAGILLAAIAYAACLFNDITIIDYTATEDGGSLSIAGHVVEVNNSVASTVLEAYTEAETRAAKWLPSKIKTAVEQVSDLLGGG